MKADSPIGLLLAVCSALSCFQFGALAQPTDSKATAVIPPSALTPDRAQINGRMEASPKADRTEEIIALEGTDTIEVEATINGVQGNFVIDTGASYVSVKKSFADRIGLKIIDGLPITLTTANGTVDAYLVQADEVRLRSLKVERVQVAVQGNGDEGFDELVDGVIGMNFLSNFDIAMNAKTLRLTSREAE